MARTKADCYNKASVKAPRKAAVLSGGQSSNVKSNSKAAKYSGGNSYCPRPTPSWQKPITTFFSKDDSLKKESEVKKPEENTLDKVSVSVDSSMGVEMQDDDGSSHSMTEEMKQDVANSASSMIEDQVEEGEDDEDIDSSNIQDD